MKKYLIASMIILTMLPFFGCFGPARRSLDRRSFYLDLYYPVLSNETAVRFNGTLEVQRFGVTSPFESKGLVYRKGKFEYESDFYNEFLISPATLVTETLYKWMSRSGLFKKVVFTDSNVAPDYVLEGNILNLYGDFTGEIPYSVIEIQFFLIDIMQKDDIVVFNKTYMERNQAASNQVEDLIAAHNQSLEQIYRKFTRDLKTF